MKVMRVRNIPKEDILSIKAGSTTNDSDDGKSRKLKKPNSRTRLIVVGLLLTLTYLATHSYYARISSLFYEKDDSSSLLCNANPYVASLTTSLDTIALQAENWLNRLDSHLVEARKPVYLKHSHERFFPFKAMSSCLQTCIGGGCGEDASKIMCGTKQLQKKNKQCVVYSIGGNNLWEFENDILSRTSCQVHTFDCTGSMSRFEVPKDNRLTFHHICLGAASQPAPKIECINRGMGAICGPIMTLTEIQSMLGHNQIDLLKFDIEGYEWPIFDNWPELSASASSSFVYPMQILVEIHYQTQFPDLWLPYQTQDSQDFRFPEDIVKLQAHFLRMGYAVIVRDDNRECKHCSELTLVRFKC